MNSTESKLPGHFDYREPCPVVTNTSYKYNNNTLGRVSGAALVTLSVLASSGYINEASANEPVNNKPNNAYHVPPYYSCDPTCLQYLNVPYPDVEPGFDGGYGLWLSNGGSGTGFDYVYWAGRVGKTEEEIMGGLRAMQLRFAQSDEWLLYNWGTLTTNTQNKSSIDSMEGDYPNKKLTKLGIETFTIVVKDLDEDGNPRVRIVTFARGIGAGMELQTD